MRGCESNFCTSILQQPVTKRPGAKTPFDAWIVTSTDFRKLCIFEWWDLLKRGNLYVHLRVSKSLKVLNRNMKMSAIELAEERIFEGPSRAASCAPGAPPKEEKADLTPSRNQSWLFQGWVPWACVHSLHGALWSWSSRAQQAPNKQRQAPSSVLFPPAEGSDLGGLISPHSRSQQVAGQGLDPSGWAWNPENNNKPFKKARPLSGNVYSFLTLWKVWKWANNIFFVFMVTKDSLHASFLSDDAFVNDLNTQKLLQNPFLFFYI